MLKQSDTSQLIDVETVRDQPTTNKALGKESKTKRKQNLLYASDVVDMGEGIRIMTSFHSSVMITRQEDLQPRLMSYCEATVGQLLLQPLSRQGNQFIIPRQSRHLPKYLLQTPPCKQVHYSQTCLRQYSITRQI